MDIEQHFGVGKSETKETSGEALLATKWLVSFLPLRWVGIGVGQ